jgi:prevent-host-death family protein
MRSVGSRELKAKLSEVLRQVRENEEVFVVTHRGRPIARIVPESPGATSAPDFAAIWSEMDRLSEEIARDWPEHVSAAEAVAADRREM